MVYWIVDRISYERGDDSCQQDHNWSWSCSSNAAYGHTRHSGAHPVSFHIFKFFKFFDLLIFDSHDDVESSFQTTSSSSVTQTTSDWNGYDPTIYSDILGCEIDDGMQFVRFLPSFMSIMVESSSSSDSDMNEEDENESGDEEDGGIFYDQPSNGLVVKGKKEEADDESESEDEDEDEKENSEDAAEILRKKKEEFMAFARMNLGLMGSFSDDKGMEDDQTSSKNGRIKDEENQIDQSTDKKKSEEEDPHPSKTKKKNKRKKRKKKTEEEDGGPEAML